MPEATRDVPVAKYESLGKSRPVQLPKATQALIGVGCCPDVLHALVQHLRTPSPPCRASPESFRELQRKAVRFGKALNQVSGLDLPDHLGDVLAGQASDVYGVARTLGQSAASLDRRRHQMDKSELGRLVGYVRLCAGKPCNRLIADFLNEQLPDAEPCTEESVRMWARRNRNGVRYSMLSVLHDFGSDDSPQLPVLSAQQRSFLEGRRREYLDSKVERKIERRRRQQEAKWARRRRLEVATTKKGLP